MRRVRVALGLGLAFTAAAVGVALVQSPAEVIAVNTPEQQTLELTRHKIDVCQPHEVLPANTHALRLQVSALLGPRVTVRVLAHGRVVTSGQRGSGWTGGVVTVPVRPVATTTPGAQLCFDVQLNGDESVSLTGEPGHGSATRAGAGGVPGRVRVEYLRPSGASWWSRASMVAKHMGFGNIANGTWSVFVVILLMGSVVCLCSYMALRVTR